MAAYLDPVREIVGPADVGLFAGRIEYDRLPFLYRLIIKAIGTGEGDFRDWEAIRTWAGELAPLLAGDA